jgi:hypothetical protein
MLHACVQRFDVMDKNKKKLELNVTLMFNTFKIGLGIFWNLSGCPRCV